MCLSRYQCQRRNCQPIRLLWDQFPTLKYSYHCEEVIDAIDWGGLFSDFLIKAVTKVVSRIGRNNECFFVLRNQSGKTAASSGLSYTSFTSDEDPVESSLFENIGEIAWILSLHYKLI